MTSVALEGLKNNINNYKGVMLCTRPNENIGAVKDRPFVSRVDPKDQVGINPVKKIKTHAAVKRVNPILARHRAWLNQFTEKMREKRIHEEIKEIQDKERFERIRENAQRGPTNDSTFVENTEDKKAASVKAASQANQQESPVHTTHAKEERVSAKPAANKKKENKDKPRWAYTEKQLEDEEEQNVDELLEFTNNLNYDEYINDLEVKHMVTALRKRIDELKGKEEDDWKNKIVDAWNNEKPSVKPSKVDIGGDDRSDCRSVASEAKSAASERSQQSISELKAKMDKHKKDWDTISTTTKKNAATLEERIAKHVADEIIRNNTEFKHFHSNASIRKILEKEAHKHLEESRGIRAPEIVSNKEYFLRKDVQDPNNLPYLHRNPAI